MQLVTDNGPENVNNIMKNILASLNVERITTSPHHPQSNDEVKSFHKPLGDIWATLARDNTENWEMYLTQALAALRFSANETSSISLYHSLFVRDVVLLMDNLLKPRRKYMLADHHQLLIEMQHRLKKIKMRIQMAQKKRDEKMNKDRKEVGLGVWDPVFYKIHLREGQLD